MSTSSSFPKIKNPKDPASHSIFPEDSPIPPSVHKRGLLGLVAKVRKKLDSDPGVPKTREATAASVRKAIRGQFSDLDEIAQENLTRVIAYHLDLFPNEPKGGFNNLREYVVYGLGMNALLAEEREIYNRHPAEFFEKDPENPDRLISRVLVECADGRNSPLLFMEWDEILKRYAIKWSPVAGLIIFPEIKNNSTEDQLRQLIQENPQIEEMILKRFDLMFAPKVERFLGNKKKNSSLSTLDFEFQSHCCQGDPQHGCGAHGSDLGSAQTENIKNCFLTEIWLKTRYPGAFEAGFFRVYRTVHDTGKKGHIYAGSYLDDTLVDPEFRTQNREVFDGAKRFDPPKRKDAPPGEEHIFRRYQRNHLKIKQESHAEQVIRVSSNHWAHTLVGQSTLEITWIDSAENMFAHLKVLLGIIEKNYRKKNPQKPAIIHLDLSSGREDIDAVYVALMEKIRQDEDIQDRLQNGTLCLYSTLTDAETFRILDQAEGALPIVDEDQMSNVAE